MVLGLILGGVAFCGGMLGIKNDIIHRAKARQFEQNRVNLKSTNELIHFAELDRQGFPSDGGEVLADIVRRNPYTTEADAQKAKNSYNSRLSNIEYINGNVATSMLPEWHENIQNEAIKDKGKGLDVYYYRVHLYRNMYKNMKDDEQRIYKAMKEDPILSQYIVKEPKVTIFDAAQWSIWTFDIPRWRIARHASKGYAEDFYEAACGLARVPISDIGKVILEDEPIKEF